VLRRWPEALKAAVAPASGGTGVALCPCQSWKKAMGDGPLSGQNGADIWLAAKIKGKRSGPVGTLGRSEEVKMTLQILGC
jgi:hypothetical protein